MGRGGAVVVAVSGGRGAMIRPALWVMVVVSVMSGIRTHGAAAPDDDGPVRLSLPSESDRAAWLRDGFRLGLGISRGKLRGYRRVPDAEMTGVIIRPGLRLDPQWSIYLSLQYATLSPVFGVGYAASIEPTWHITPYLAVSLGVGYAGLSGISVGPGPRDPDPVTDQSYTYPDAGTPLSSCTGAGVTGVGRVELGYVLGPRARTYVSLQGLGQWTGCEEGIGPIDDYSGRALVRRQFWVHTGASIAWGIEWR